MWFGILNTGERSSRPHGSDHIFEIGIYLRNNFDPRPQTKVLIQCEHSGDISVFHYGQV